ncbi:MAG: peptide MFS transporter [Cyanobacteria bacterium REEB67]|nr:peptide MFS transporter [Cyanobacteria bacterium REEB67]
MTGSQEIDADALANNAGPDARLSGGLGGHPRGLNVLFFTEMWERFSYYGMRAILVLFMVAPVVNGGLGFSMAKASTIYAWYTMCVYLTSIPGGYIADKLIGPRKAVLIGGTVIALGHFTMAFQSLPAFYGGMIIIVLGTGLLKPNISTMVGRLYPASDRRRDAGFSIFYMGINLGATLSPLVCGTLAQGAGFKTFLKQIGMQPESSWHFGFAAAGVGMCLGLIHLLAQYKVLDGIGDKIVLKAKEKSASQDPEPAADSDQVSTAGALTEGEQSKLWACAILFAFNILFWAVYEQGGSSLNVFADRLTETSILGFHFESSWLQALQPIYVIALAPVFSWIWIKMGEKQPASPAKFALGLAFLSLGILIMVPAALMSAQGKVSALFLITVYFVETLGELCLSPIGLSTVTKLAPARFQSLLMGGWFVSNSIGNFLAGLLSSLFKSDSSTEMAVLFGSMAGAAFCAAALLFVLTPKIRTLMGSVR